MLCTDEQNSQWVSCLIFVFDFNAGERKDS